MTFVVVVPGCLVDGESNAIPLLQLKQEVEEDEIVTDLRTKQAELRTVVSARFLH